MTYTLFTATNRSWVARHKMDAAAEQEYYEAAAAPALTIERMKARLLAFTGELSKPFLLLRILVTQGANAKASVAQSFNESNNAA